MGASHAYLTVNSDMPKSSLLTKSSRVPQYSMPNSGANGHCNMSVHCRINHKYLAHHCLSPIEVCIMETPPNPPSLRDEMPEIFRNTFCVEHKVNNRSSHRSFPNNYWHIAYLQGFH